MDNILLVHTKKHMFVASDEVSPMINPGIGHGVTVNIIQNL